jgi:hypothetical protein
MMQRRVIPRLARVRPRLGLLTLIGPAVTPAYLTASMNVLPSALVYSMAVDTNCASTSTFEHCKGTYVLRATCSTINRFPEIIRE